MAWYANKGPTPAPHHQGIVADDATGHTIAVTYDDPDGAKARMMATSQLLFKLLGRARDWLSDLNQSEEDGGRFLRLIDNALREATGN